MSVDSRAERRSLQSAHTSYRRLRYRKMARKDARIVAGLYGLPTASNVAR